MTQQIKNHSKFLSEIGRTQAIEYKLSAITSEQKIKLKDYVSQQREINDITSHTKKSDESHYLSRKIQNRIDKMEHYISKQIIDIQYEVRQMKDLYQNFSQKCERDSRNRRLLLQKNRKAIDQIKQKVIIQLAYSRQNQIKATQESLLQFDFKLHLILQQMVQLTNVRDIFVSRMNKMNIKCRQQIQKYEHLISLKNHKIGQLKTQFQTEYQKVKANIKQAKIQQIIRFQKMMGQIKNTEQLIKKQLNQERDVMQVNKEKIIEAIQLSQKLQIH